MQVACGQQPLPGVATETAPGDFSPSIWPGIAFLALLLGYVAAFIAALICWPVVTLAAVAGCLAVLGWCWLKAPVVEDRP